MKSKTGSGLVALALLGAVLAGCSARQEPPAAAASPSASAAAMDAEKELNIYNWSDYIDPSIVPDFEKEYGIKVRYDVFDSNEIVETKLLAGKTGYDLVVPSASFLERQIKAGVFQKLDKSLLPNLKNADADIYARVATHDPGNAYAVNYFWGTSGIGYNVDKINAALQGAPVDSFRMLYDPAVVRHFADCGVSILDAPDEVYGTVLVYLGKDPNVESDANLKLVGDTLMKVRPYIRLIDSSKYIEGLANGELCLALGWNGDVGQSAARAEEAGKGIKIKYNIPKEGAIMFFDMLAIPADAAHPKNAHLFINYLLRPEVAAKNSDFVHYATSNAAAYALVDPAVYNDRGVYPAPETKTRLYPNAARSPQFTRALNDVWTQFRAGR
ncbi:MAG: polyamine ABC transporter substrate-binding protein [Gammaproteobacteria bacterium]|nr:polyamine ABC transporter substrate-binding protein [Gammaproteobacteria bacterium]